MKEGKNERHDRKRYNALVHSRTKQTGIYVNVNVDGHLYVYNATLVIQFRRE